MQLLTCTLMALACITCAAAHPINTADQDLEADSTTYNFEFSAPNCSELAAAEPDFDQSNRTHIFFRAGLKTMKEYLRDIRSELNKTITMEDQESFVPCYPPPVDITELKQSMRFNNITATNLADWYGVLVAYTNMTLGLLGDEEMPHTTTEKLRIVLKMLTTVLSHFSGVIGPRKCTTDFEVPTYPLVDNSECTSNFNSIKHAANTISHLQTVVSTIVEVQKDWYRQERIGRFLNKILSSELGSTWIERFITNENC